MSDPHQVAVNGSRAQRPRIPDQEIRERPSILGRQLSQAGFDGWIAFGDDRAVAGADHIRYLADLAPHFEPVILAGRSSDPAITMLTGPETIGYAETTTARTAVSDIVAIEELVHPDEEYPTMGLESGAALLRDLFSGTQRVAVLGLNAIPFPIYEALIVPLKEQGVDVERGDEVAYALRAVKTPAEDAVIDEAYRIVRAGLLAAASAVRPGAVEREVAAQAESAMRAAGAEGFGIDTMVASGTANTAPMIARSTFRTIEPDDLVTVTLAPRYEGYHAAIARAFLFRPNREVEHAVDVARAGQEAALERLVVGRQGRESALALSDTVNNGQAGVRVPYVPVHSIGLIEFEPPIFESTTETPVREGMAISIDAPLFSGSWGGLRLEDGFSVRAPGPAPRLDDWREVVPLVVA